MREIWIRPNRRAILAGCVPLMVAALLGAGIAVTPPGSYRILSQCIGLGIATISLAMLGLAFHHVIRPRLAYCDGKILFYLRSGSPIMVPVEIVEAFFLGRGPAHVPMLFNHAQAVNLIGRLSQRYPEWAQQQVKPALGKWSDGYVTIHGTWCEPLNSEVIRRINRRLKEVKEKARESRAI